MLPEISRVVCNEMRDGHRFAAIILLESEYPTTLALVGRPLTIEEYD